MGSATSIKRQGNSLSKEEVNLPREQVKAETKEEFSSLKKEDFPRSKNEENKRTRGYRPSFKYAELGTLSEEVIQKYNKKLGVFAKHRRVVFSESSDDDPNPGVLVDLHWTPDGEVLHMSPEKAKSFLEENKSSCQDMLYIFKKPLNLKERHLRCPSRTKKTPEQLDVLDQLFMEHVCTSSKEELPSFIQKRTFFGLHPIKTTSKHPHLFHVNLEQMIHLLAHFVVPPEDLPKIQRIYLMTEPWPSSGHFLHNDKGMMQSFSTIFLFS
jgi:hypothetical protein